MAVAAGQNVTHQQIQALAFVPQVFLFKYMFRLIKTRLIKGCCYKVFKGATVAEWLTLLPPTSEIGVWFPA